MDLAKNLIRLTVRAFYSTEQILVVDALAIHSALNDMDLAHVLGMPVKTLRKHCGRLKEDGLVSVHSLQEKKEGAPPATFHTKDGTQTKERTYSRDYYYLNYHRAIDSLKYRLWKLSRHIESLGAPTMEKKDLVCPRCKSSWTELEVMDNISSTGDFLCHKCQHTLNPAEEDGLTGENESMKRLNDQLSRIVAIMRQIDSTDVPENDFQTAFSHALPIDRGANNPDRKVQIINDPKPSLASTKGLALAPEKVSVSVMEDGAEVKLDPEEAARRRAEEAKQNALPDWIVKSTISGDITSVGAKEAAERAAREAHHAGLSVEDTVGDDKKAGISDDGVMEAYFAQLKAEQERQALEEQDEEDDDDDDEDDEEDDDDFEDVDVAGVATTAESSFLPSISVSTPDASGQPSSTATDDEAPAAKKAKMHQQPHGDANASAAATAPVDTKTESKNGESDEDEFDFEDVVA